MRVLGGYALCYSGVMVNLHIGLAVRYLLEDSNVELP